MAIRFVILTVMLVLAPLGASAVHLSDLSIAAELLRDNVFLNRGCGDRGPSARCHATVGDFRMGVGGDCDDTAALGIANAFQADIVLGCDILYNTTMIGHVCYSLRHLLLSEKVQNTIDDDPNDGDGDGSTAAQQRRANEGWVVFCDRTRNGDPEPEAAFAESGLRVLEKLNLTKLACAEKLLQSDEYDYMIDVDVFLFRVSKE